MSDPNQLVTTLENLLLSPSSDFYLSKILHDPSGAAADPALVATLDLGTFSVAGIAVGLVLNAVTIKGLSNVQIKIDPPSSPEISVCGDRVTFHATLPNRQPGYTRPSDVPDQIEITGGITVSIGGAAMPPGTISVVVKSVDTFTGVFDATEDIGGKLSTARIELQSIAIKIDTANANIVLTLSLQTGFVTAINQVLNQPSTLDSFISLAQAQFNDPKILKKISDVATQAARQALGQTNG